MNCILLLNFDNEEEILDNFTYGATTFSLIFTKKDIFLGKLDNIYIISYRMKKWCRHTETFPLLLLELVWLQNKYSLDLVDFAQLLLLWFIY